MSSVYKDQGVLAEAVLGVWSGSTLCGLSAAAGALAVTVSVGEAQPPSGQDVTANSWPDRAAHSASDSGGAVVSGLPLACVGRCSDAVQFTSVKYHLPKAVGGFW